MTNENIQIDIPDSEESREEYNKETGKNAIWRGKQTNAYKKWLESKEEIEETEEEKEETEKPKFDESHPKIQYVIKKFDIKKLANEYKTTENDIKDNIVYWASDELVYNSDIDKEQLCELVDRDIRIHMKGHKISDAVPVKFQVFSKRNPFNYGKRRRDDLKKLFSLDPKKAINEGIGDAVCDENGEIIFKEGKTFNKGDYPDNRYIYEILLLGKRLDKDDKRLISISMTVYEDDDLTIHDSLELEKWYAGKISLSGEEENELNLIGNVTKVTEFKEATPENLTFVDLKTKKGLLYDDVLSVHHVQLSDLKVYFDKFSENGRLPVNRYVIVIGDVVNVLKEKNTFYISDNSLKTDDLPITVFDNRSDKSVRFGTRSKILVIGALNKDTRIQNKENYTINASGIKLIPREKGGYYYPEIIKKAKDITVKTTKKTRKEPSKEREEKKTKSLEFDKNLVSEEIQDKIVSTLYKLEQANIDELSKETNLKRDDVFDSSLSDLLKREIIKEENGVYIL